MLSYTPIPIYTTPVPAFDLVNELNNIINQINGNFNTAAGAENAQSLPWVAGRFYGLPRGATPGTLLLTASTIYAYPIYIPGATPIKTIAIDSTTGQTGGAVHAGLYYDAAGVPGGLVPGSDSGALAATSTAVASATLATALNLAPGWYWAAMSGTASSTMPTVAAIASSYTSEVNAEMGSDTAAHAFATSGENTLGVTGTVTYGALPATFPTPTLNQATAIPMVVFGT
jgi:hypothetical protein